MARHLILIVCSDDELLQRRHAIVLQAGHRPLPAQTISRALMLIRTVRPNLVLADAELSDGRAHALLREIRAIAALERVPVVVIGLLLPEEHDFVTRDAYAHARHATANGAIAALLEEFLGAA